MDPAQIEVISTMTAIRKRLHMYVDDVHDPLLANLFVQECFCLARNWARSHDCSSPWQLTHSDGWITLQFPGMSFPVEEARGRWKIERILTEIGACLHVELNDNETCRYGIVVANAACQEFSFSTSDGTWTYFGKYSGGEPVDRGRVPVTVSSTSEQTKGGGPVFARFAFKFDPKYVPKPFDVDAFQSWVTTVPELQSRG